MKDLLYKEFKLAQHPTMYMFPFLGAMLLIPSYMYFVAFIYTCLSVFLIFLTGRENKDVYFTVSLPVKKSDAVRARFTLIAIIEVSQIIVSVPFAILGHMINSQDNAAGIEANVALFGLVFIMYALLNVIFMPIFYKTAYKAGTAFLFAGIAVCIYIGIVEVAVQLFATLKTFIDTNAPDMMVKQVGVLIVGILIYMISTWIAYKISVKRFERVDL